MITRIISSLTMIACFVLYTISESEDRDVLLAAAIIVAIGEVSDRIGSKP